MSADSIIVQTLSGFVAGRVYPDIAPAGVTALPRITFQAVGGRPVNYLSNELPTAENSRHQINVWGATRLQASALARQVRDALRAEPALHTVVLNEPIAVYESDTKLYGTYQDFSLWTT